MEKASRRQVSGQLVLLGILTNIVFAPRSSSSWDRPACLQVQYVQNAFRSSFRLLRILPQHVTCAGLGSTLQLHYRTIRGQDDLCRGQSDMTFLQRCRCRLHMNSTALGETPPKRPQIQANPPELSRVRAKQQPMRS